MSMKIKKGDRVRVMRGAETDKDKIGEVVRVYTKTNRVTVQGVNLAKRHQKQRQEDGKTLPSGIVEFEAPIDVSNVMLVDAKGEKIAKERSARRTAKINLEAKSRKATASAKKAVAPAAEKTSAKPVAKTAAKPAAKAAAKPAAKAAAKPGAKSAVKKTADKPTAKKATTAKPAAKKTETKTAATKPATKKAAAKPATKTSGK
jgi:ribosomal protein L24